MKYEKSENKNKRNKRNKNEIISFINKIKENSKQFVPFLYKKNLPLYFKTLLMLLSKNPEPN